MDLNVLEKIEIKLKAIWHEYQTNLKNEQKAKALLQQYRQLYNSYKWHKAIVLG